MSPAQIVRAMTEASSLYSALAACHWSDPGLYADWAKEALERTAAAMGYRLGPVEPDDEPAGEPAPEAA